MYINTDERHCMVRHFAVRHCMVNTLIETKERNLPDTRLDNNGNGNPVTIDIVSW